VVVGAVGGEAEVATQGVVAEAGATMTG